VIQIEKGALFIADAHYPTHGDTLLELLHHIDTGKLVVPQLFLMGDIFDLLVGGLEKSYALNAEATARIQSISRHTDIFYFEGNHDFQLKKIFKNINIYPRGDQPQYMGYKGYTIGLSHGDRFASGWKHDLLSRVLRNPLILTAIKWLKPHIIAQKRTLLSSKEICRELPDFKTKAKEIFDSYGAVDWVIEGHYHQGGKHEEYISLPSLVCQKQVGIMGEKGIIFVSVESLSRPASAPSQKAPL